MQPGKNKEINIFISKPPNKTNKTEINLAALQHHLQSLTVKTES